MKRIILAITAIILLAISLTGCARPMVLSPAVNREYDFRDFSRVEIGFTHDVLVVGNTFEVPVDLEVVQSDSFRVNILANDNIFEYITVSQTLDTLKIKINRARITTNEATIKATINMPELAGLKLNSGVVRAAVFSNAPVFQAEVSGASRLNMKLKTGSADFKISSSSDVVLNGSTTDFNAEVSGASTLRADLATSQVVIKASSSSDVDFRGNTGSLQAICSGASALDIDVQTSKADFILSSSSELSGELTSTGLNIEAKEASQANLAGSAERAVLTATGSSDIIMLDLQIQEAGLVLSGASTGKLNVSKSLDVDLSGASDLVYWGNPVLGNIQVSGSSTIDHRQ